MPSLAATASASSTTSSRDSTRSPSASIPTLHLTRCPFIVPPSRAVGPGGPPWLREADRAKRRRRCERFSLQRRQERRELFEAAQVVAGQHQVHGRCHHHHPERAGPESGVVALVRV